MILLNFLLQLEVLYTIPPFALMVRLALSLCLSVPMATYRELEAVLLIVRFKGLF
jgi:hypothetical protein